MIAARSPRTRRIAVAPVIAIVVVVSTLLAGVPGVPTVHRGSLPATVKLGFSGQTGGVIRVGSYPFGIAFDPVNDHLFVADFGDSPANLSVVDTVTNRVVATVSMPGQFETAYPVYDSGDGLVYVDTCCAQVYAINATTNRVVGSTTVGLFPGPKVYDPANQEVYVTDLGSNNVTAFRGVNASVPFGTVATIPVGTNPNGIGYDSANGDVYVVNEGSSNLTVIDGATNRVVGQVSPVNPGSGVAYDSSNGDLYICSNSVSIYRSNAMTVVNGTSNEVVESLPIASGCEASIYDSSNGYVYVTDRANTKGQDLSNVTVFDPTANQIVLTLPVQMGPTGIAYDSANDNVYVADSDTNNLSILPQIYRLTVHETGLPAGTNWSATVGGTTFSSTTPSITFPETNGTFDFTIANVTNRTANPSSGTVTVSGRPQALNVTFSKGGGSGLFGLPGATGYYVLVGIGAVAAILIAVVVILSRKRKRGAAAGPPSPPQSPPTTENRPP